MFADILPAPLDCIAASMIACFAERWSGWLPPLEVTFSLSTRFLPLPDDDCVPLLAFYCGWEP